MEVTDLMIHTPTRTTIRCRQCRRSRCIQYRQYRRHPNPDPHPLRSSPWDRRWTMAIRRSIIPGQSIFRTSFLSLYQNFMHSTPGNNGHACSCFTDFKFIGLRSGVLRKAHIPPKSSVAWWKISWTLSCNFETFEMYDGHLGLFH